MRSGFPSKWAPTASAIRPRESEFVLFDFVKFRKHLVSYVQRLFDVAKTALQCKDHIIVLFDGNHLDSLTDILQQGCDQASMLAFGFATRAVNVLCKQVEGIALGINCRFLLPLSWQPS